MAHGEKGETSCTTKRKKHRYEIKLEWIGKKNGWKKISISGKTQSYYQCGNVNLIK